MLWGVGLRLRGVGLCCKSFNLYSSFFSVVMGVDMANRYFLRKAMLIMILASIQAQNANHLSAWKRNVEYVSMAAGLLEDSTDTSPTSGQGMDVIKRFLDSLEYGSKMS
jgi:hypothetical protein